MKSRLLVATTGILLALAGSSPAASSTDPAQRRYESTYFKRPHHRADSTAKTRKFVPAPPLKTTVHRRKGDDVGPVSPARTSTGTAARGARATSAAAGPRGQSSSRATTLGKPRSGSGSSSTHSKGSCGWTIRTGAGKHSCK